VVTYDVSDATNKWVVTAGVLDSAGVADWTALGISIYDHMVEVTESSNASSVPNGTYKITTIHGTNGLTLTGTSGTADCTFRVLRGPKVYDPVERTLSMLTPSAGMVAVGCSIVTECWGRLIWSGQPHAPHVWFASRAGDPLDYDYGASSIDSARAFAGTEDSGFAIGEPITAAIRASGDTLVLASSTSMTAISGDPLVGGSAFPLSDAVGVVGKSAHCYGPAGEVYFLGRPGVHMIGAEASSRPQPISKLTVPNELLAIDGSSYDVSMAYDVADQGIHLYVTSTGEGSANHWWIDEATMGLWPVAYPLDYGPTCCTRWREPNLSSSNVLLAGKDGLIRRLDPQATDDDGATMDSRVDLGPLSLGSLYNEAILHEIQGFLGSDSGSVDWTIRVGNSPEEAYDSITEVATGTWTEGRSYAQHPRQKGCAAVIRLSADGYWELESAVLRIVPAGKMRLP
jgi:hypothetical protein